VASEATDLDFYALGLHPDAVADAQAMVSRVSHVGSNAGSVVVAEGSAPLGTYDVRLQVVASGAPGTATVRWSLDKGVTWSATVTAPAASAPLVIGATGMAVVFAGALVAGDLYSFVAARALERHLSAANAKVRSYLRRRFKTDLASWDDSLIAAAVSIAALSLLTQRGFDPKNPGDQAVADRASDGTKFVKDVGASIAHPEGVLDVTDTAPEVFSDEARGD
jgi:phage gp36-like protein